MRILHRNIKVTRIIFHPFAAIFYFLVLAYFLYANYRLFPMWIGVQNRLADAKQIYEKKINKKQNIDDQNEIISTEEGKKRYEKEFFNKLDYGEKMIILYSDPSQEKPKSDEELRTLSRWEKIKQQVKLWWANL